ncbi:hypothetical protein CBR_g24443 [Chara braunii]|uniref:Uncharacterized protein n=1 Tax=Chara braunii TaxID=69332 RepID=A0A388JMN7_CHABU|nr:hypothetical protein CBR_g24443 [Chara braunii]|eukprot:GBG59100.1 hypothetical protein CBR_g24443 [Chara braunii]
MEEHYAVEREKKESKQRRKLEREEVERRAEEERVRMEERARAERKALKIKQKKALEAEARGMMQKDLNIQLAIQVGELENRLVDRMYQVVAPVPPSTCNRGNVSGSNDLASDGSDESDTSVTHELSARAQRMSIIEKRKRGPKPVFEEPSPPMELPAKRTLERGILKPVKLTGHLTQSKSKKAGGGLTPTSTRKKIATPLSKRKTPTCSPAHTPAAKVTPTTKGVLARLRNRNEVLKELKALDAAELQAICRKEDLQYDKKIDAIFDIANHRTETAFASSVTGNAEVIHIAASADTSDNAEAEPATDV